MSIGIDPTVDFAFKKLLGSPEFPQVTVHFLNSVLGESANVTDVTILNPILGKDYDNDKTSLLDVLAEDASGQKLNIEMQTTLPAGIFQRLAYYTASLYVEQLNESFDYSTLRPAISICVLSRNLFPAVPNLHLDFRLRDRELGIAFTDALQIHTIELPKYVLLDNNVRVTDPIEKWAWFFRFAPSSTIEQIRERLDDEVFVIAAGILQMISKTPHERMLYNARMKMQRDEVSKLLYAQREGIAEGEQNGAIHMLQQILGLPETPREELARLSAESREAVVEELKIQLRKRGQLG